MCYTNLFLYFCTTDILFHISMLQKHLTASDDPAANICFSKSIGNLQSNQNAL